MVWTPAGAGVQEGAAGGVAPGWQRLPLRTSPAREAKMRWEKEGEKERERGAERGVALSPSAGASDPRAPLRP